MDLSTPEDLRTSKTTYVYRAFGFLVVSNIPVPGLAESGESPGSLNELRMTWGMRPASLDSALNPGMWSGIWYESAHRVGGVPFLTIYTSSTETRDYWLRYVTGIDIFLSDGLSHMWVAWPDTSCQEDAATYVFGPVMAILAQLRGATCLHGCAVVINGAVIGLLGPQGAGKSTSAAAFARLGYPVVTDDLILLEENSGGFVVEPTYPVVRLWPVSVEMLFGHEDAVPQLTPDWDKRGLNVAEGEFNFQREPLPLAALYLLQPRSDSPRAPFLAPVSGSAAVVQLIRNSWAHYVNKPDFLAAQLRVLIRLSGSVPIREVTASRDFDRISDFCSVLVRDARTILAERRAVPGAEPAR